MEKRCLVVILSVVVSSIIGLLVGFVVLANTLNAWSVKSYKCLDDQCQCTNLVADCSYRDVTFIGPVPETVKVLKLSFTQDSFGRRIVVEHDKDVFVNVTSVESLFLVACGLTSIPKVPVSVITVDLSHNPLGHIGVGDLLKLSPKTVSLSLSSCELSYVAEGAFKVLPLLRRLDLSYNLFPQVWKSGITEPMLQKMDYLDLTVNVYLECDEGAALLGKYIRSRPYAFITSESSSPYSLHGQYACSDSTTKPPKQKSILELPYPQIHPNPRNRSCASINSEAFNVSSATASNSSSCDETALRGDYADGESIYLVVVVVLCLVAVSLVVALVYMAVKKTRRDIGYRQLSQFA